MVTASTTSFLFTSAEGRHQKRVEKLRLHVDDAQQGGGFLLLLGSVIDIQHRVWTHYVRPSGISSQSALLSLTHTHV